mmetsp:Transcript_75032/g.175986  ORF Transcript_75032/g.175986 Transcript_75032/m.175986 type:complete len:152 (+) Transcript_75032:1336-1791(+)
MYDNFKERMQDLEMLEEYAGSYDSLEDMADSLQLDDSVLEKGRARNKSGDTLTLSSMHSAKGLEWDVVFVIGMDPNSFGSNLISGDDEKEEARRVLYVSVTRAKRNLYLTVPDEEAISLLADVPDLDKLVHSQVKSRPRRLHLSHLQVGSY